MIKIKLVKSSFYREEETKNKLIKFVKNAKIFSLNEECFKFEKAFAKKQNRKYAVFVSSGSSANLVLIQALLNLGRLKKKDTVGFTALTWATNVMPLFQLGLRPVALDVDLCNLNISEEESKKHIKDLDALFITNVLGFCGNMTNIENLCRKHKVMLLEDNCEALGSITKGRKLGNWSLASTFSFFVGHHMSTIEGGMICTDDKELHEMLVMVRAHGWSRNLHPDRKIDMREEHSISEFYCGYTFYNLAYNARPTEISGFIGNTQLQYLDEIVKKREKNFLIFHKALHLNPDFIKFELDHMDTISNFAMPMICHKTGVIEKYKKRFKDAGVEIRPILAGNITRQPFYLKHNNHRPKECPNTHWIHENGFYFPNNPELTKNELDLLQSLLAF